MAFAHPTVPGVAVTGYPRLGRGCGKRKQQQAYMVCALEFGTGKPVHEFFRDPVEPWPEWHRGMKIVPRADGVNDVLIFVGRSPSEGDGYKAAWDFLKESMLYGTSRRPPSDFDFEALTPRHYDPKQDKMVGSRQHFVYSHAYYDQHYQLAIEDSPPPLGDCHVARDYAVDWTTCYKGWHPRNPSLYNPKLDQCTFALRELAYFEHLGEDTMTLDDRIFSVKFASVQYSGHIPCQPTLANYDSTRWKPGIIMSLPITGIEWCGEADNEKMQHLGKLGFSNTILPY